jgi:ribosomal protein S16
MHVRLRTPDLTEELVRFLSRMGYRAREVDYGVVAVDADADRDGEHLLGYLRVWQRVNARAAFEVEGEPTARAA